MSIRMILEINLTPEAAGSMEAGMKEALPDTRAYDGCISVDVMKSADDPNKWALVEEWESKGHHERYMQWRTETGFMDKWASMFAGEPSMTYWEPVDA